MKNTEVTEIVILTLEFVKINNLIHIVAPTILKYLKTAILALVFTNAQTLFWGS